MADLTVVAVLVAQPGKEDVVREALTDLVPPTLQEQGCISHALSQSAAQPAAWGLDHRGRVDHVAVVGW